MIVNGKVIYSRAGWVTAQFDSSCSLCGSAVQQGAKVIRVAAHINGGNWAGTCCASEAEELSGFWELRPNAPRESQWIGAEDLIEFAEYTDVELPDVLRAQVLAFLRINWPDGFVGPNRFRNWTSHPSLKPFHQVFAAGPQLVSHLEIVTVAVTVNDRQYRAVSPTAVLTYPAFRGEGWSSRLNAAAVRRIDDSDADLGLLTCSADLIDFYAKAGWTHAQEATVIAGPEGATWVSDDVLLVRPVGERSRQPLLDLRQHALRVQDEW